MTPERYVTVGAVAVRLGLMEHRVRELADRKLVPYGVAGRVRLFREADLGLIEQEARRLGFLGAAQPA